MSRPRWRILGLVACLLWTFVLGSLLLLLHSPRIEVSAAEQLHSTLLFIASAAMVYWLIARREGKPQPIIVAELVPEDEILTPFRQDEP